jgi:signal peptidase
MSHDPPGERLGIPPSQLGVIDGGDMVIVKKVADKSDITTYVQGKKTGYQTYGSYGDVVIYHPPSEVRNDPTPVIHRVVVWVEFNTTTGSSWDIPEMGYYNKVTTITIQEYGYNSKNVTINLATLTNNFRVLHRLPHSGYITMGDHNSPGNDQENGVCVEPVKFEWIIGVARGELPWFGALKLWFSGKTEYVPENTWYYLVASITVIIIIPIILDYIIDRIRNKRKKMKKQEMSGGGTTQEKKKSTDQDGSKNPANNDNIKDIGGSKSDDTNEVTPDGKAGASSDDGKCNSNDKSTHSDEDTDR